MSSTSAAARLSFDSVDPPLLSHFWAAVTGYRIAVNEPDYIRLEGRGLGVNQLVFREVARWKAAPNRVQLDIVTRHIEREAARLTALGATMVGEMDGHGEQRIVLRDPEGNEFSLVEKPRPVRLVPVSKGRK